MPPPSRTRAGAHIGNPSDATPIEDYLALLDWTARQPVVGKRGATPSDTPAILQRLGLEADAWCELSRDFDKLFSLVAGRPQPSIKPARVVVKRVFARDHERAS